MNQCHMSWQVVARWVGASAPRQRQQESISQNPGNGSTLNGVRLPWKVLLCRMLSQMTYKGVRIQKLMSRSFHFSWSADLCSAADRGTRRNDMNTAVPATAPHS